MIEPKIRPIDQWPPGWRDANRAETRRPSPFRNSYGDTLGQLDEELGHLDATEWHLQLDVQPGHLRRDGQLRADADVRHPGVILTVVTAAHTVVLKTDRFVSTWYGTKDWHANLRATVLGLTDLRRFERYGALRRRRPVRGIRRARLGDPPRSTHRHDPPKRPPGS